MFEGIEIDMLSLGDADSILVTQWTAYGPFRVLIDGGSGDDAERVKGVCVSETQPRLGL